MAVLFSCTGAKIGLLAILGEGGETMQLTKPAVINLYKKWEIINAVQYLHIFI